MPALRASVGEQLDQQSVAGTPLEQAGAGVLSSATAFGKGSSWRTLAGGLDRRGQPRRSSTGIELLGMELQLHRHRRAPIVQSRHSPACFPRPPTL